MYGKNEFEEAGRRLTGALRRFISDRGGNFAVTFVLMLFPIGLSVAAAVEYTQITREKQSVMHALDAAAVASGREFLMGATTAELKTYGSNFFYANIGSLDPKTVAFSLDFPQSNVAGGQMAAKATLTYHPTFAKFVNLVSAGKANWNTLTFNFTSTVRLKNTEEVALVLDNSGSMSDIGPSGITRLQLLKNNAKQLVQTLFQQGGQIQQLVDPVKFSVVPFSSAVNVAYTDAGGNPMVDRYTPWIDGYGLSPIHNEDLDWSKYTDSKGRGAHQVGYQWLDADNNPLTRFTLFDAMQSTFGPWKGCVEARPYPYNIEDTPPSISNPATLFVPMFAPDEFDTPKHTRSYNYNNYWPDYNDPNESPTLKQSDVRKYFQPRPRSFQPSRNNTYYGDVANPNSSCDSAPLIPLTNDQRKIDNAIDAMVANGATDVPEGIAWGMRTLSSTEPFTEGRSEKEKGNDKIIVLVTDGSNTYYTPESLGYSDSAVNKSIYAAYGYAHDRDPGATDPRIFMGTKTNSANFSNANYTAAMNETMQATCNYAKRTNADTGRETIEILVIALDLDQKKDADMIKSLSNCASPTPAGIKLSNGSSKLFWNVNSTGADEVFKEIAELLSNLRITS